MKTELSENINIREATKDDTEKLIKLRLDYLTEDNEQLTDEEINTATQKLREYFNKYLNNPDNSEFFAVIAEIDGEPVATAFLVISEKPVNPRYFITGKKADILNVLTYPKYRRKGVATKMLEMLIDRAKKENASFIDLAATEMGKPVYEKLGFKIKPTGKHTPMRYEL